MNQTQTKTRAKATKRPTTEHLVERIRETLLYFGGEAHRRDVIVNVARDIGVDVKNIPEELENAVILSFEETWRDEARRAAYGFHLRFGEGSHRWGLKPATAH
ncbi:MULTISPECIES: hypothetical protein [Phenylobacterium]|uniref:Uncharacterized protein n=1 Tax=Phenylobacterium koreense TaxID=266125 RepID=A0ABV2EF63_9CAUL